LFGRRKYPLIFAGSTVAAKTKESSVGSFALATKSFRAAKISQIIDLLRPDSTLSLLLSLKLILPYAAAALSHRIRPPQQATTALHCVPPLPFTVPSTASHPLPVAHRHKAPLHPQAARARSGSAAPRRPLAVPSLARPPSTARCHKVPLHRKLPVFGPAWPLLAGRFPCSVQLGRPSPAASHARPGRPTPTAAHAWPGPVSPRMLAATDHHRG
jgi:hypothetical protein